MAFCSKCGEQVADDVKNCPKCGADMSADEKKQSVAEKANEAWSQINNTADDTSSYDENDIKSNKAMSILAYIGILFLIPLFAAKDSKFARFHTNQGLVLFIANIICSILAKLPIIQWVGWIISIVLFVFWILGIVNACKGRAKELPLIGGIKILK